MSISWDLWFTFSKRQFPMWAASGFFVSETNICSVKYTHYMKSIKFWLCSNHFFSSGIKPQNVGIWYHLSRMEKILPSLEWEGGSPPFLFIYLYFFHTYRSFYFSAVFSNIMHLK